MGTKTPCTERFPNIVNLRFLIYLGLNPWLELSFKTRALSSSLFQRMWASGWVLNSILVLYSEWDRSPRTMAQPCHGPLSACHHLGMRTKFRRKKGSQDLRRIFKRKKATSWIIKHHFPCQNNSVYPLDICWFSLSSVTHQLCYPSCKPHCLLLFSPRLSDVSTYWEWCWVILAKVSSWRLYFK